jgi:hypothetical protein
MKMGQSKNILLIGLLLSGVSSPALAEVCYKVFGSVSTTNVTDAIQVGQISLALTDGSGNTAFADTGNLVGQITGAVSTGTTVLEHTAKFSQGNGFKTEGDTAQIIGTPLDFDEDGIPCAFPVLETITTIRSGTRFFKKVSRVSVEANGSINFCPDTNQNQFDLSGEICVEN